MSAAAEVAQVSTNTVGIDVVSSNPTITSSLNFSLIKGQTVLQLAAGIFITASVLVATALAVTIFAVTVKPDYPQPVPDSRETFKVTAIVIDVLTNDLDPRKSNLTVSSVTQPLFGKATIQGGKFVKYTPNKYYAGWDSFNYTAKNDRYEATTWVKVFVKNHPPECTPFTIQINKNAKKAALVLTNPDPLSGKKVEDIDDDILTVVSTSVPEHGTVELSGATIFYTPENKFNGNELLNYTISDGNDTCSSTISLTIANNPPVINPDSFTSRKNILCTLPVLANDFDPNEDDITITNAYGVQQGGIRISANKQFLEYLPILTKAGYTDSFEYEITDGTLFASTYGTITLTNTPPTAGMTDLTVYKNSKDNIIPLSYADTDPFETLTVSVVPGVQGNYSIKWNETKTGGMFLGDRWTLWNVYSYTLTWSPPAGKVYTDRLTYAVSDGASITQGYVNLNVVNQAPVAENVIAACPWKRSVDINVVSEATDPNGDPVILKRLASGTTTMGGTITVKNSTHVSYQAPLNGATGTDTFTFVLADVQEDPSKSLEASATAFVNVRADNIVNNPPVCSDIVTAVTKVVNTGQRSFSLAGCTDADNDTLSFSVVPTSHAASCKKGAITFFSNGGNPYVTYTSNVGRSGQDTCAFLVSDGFTSVQKNFIFNIANRAPSSVSASNYVFNQSPTPKTYTLSVLATGTDPDIGDTLVVTSTTDSGACMTAAGTFQVSGNSILYTTKTTFADTTCTFTFTYQDSDVDGPIQRTGTASVKINNKPPVANDVLYQQDNSPAGTGLWSKSVAELIQNAYDPDGDAVSWVSFSCPAADGSGSYCQRLPAYANGNTYVQLPVNKQSCDSVRFKYTVRTPDSLQATGTITVKYINCICYKPVDVMFVLDGSGSIGTANWQRTRDFVSNIIGKFQISSTQARIGVVQFSEIASLNWASKYGWELSTEPVATQQSKATQLVQMSSWTATLAGINLAVSHMESKERPGVPKVIIVFTDGAANKPCSCSECSTLFNGDSNKCTNTTYWPGQTCSNCAWDPDNGKWCMPCADPRPRANEINSRPGWKIVAIGVGNEGSPLPPLAWTQVQGIAYKKDAAFLIDWSQTTAIFQTIVDYSCDSS